MLGLALRWELGVGAELSYLIILSRDLGFVDQQRARDLLAELDEILRMLYALRQKVERRPGNPDD